MTAALAIAGYGLRESLRRRIFAVVVVLTFVFLVLYGLGASFAFDEATTGPADRLVKRETIVGSTVFGLAMFAIMFLGTVLGVFLTLSVVRGDAEQGVLQPLVARPVGRTTLLVARFASAAAVCVAYVGLVYAAALLITWVVGDWTPDRVLTPGLGLAAGVTILIALSVLGSCYLTANANGIAVLMAFGAGLTAGLLGQIGEALGSGTLDDVSEVASWLLPFEALYQAGLHELTVDSSGLTRFVVNLGPFGGAEAASPLLGLWAVVYLGLIGLAARASFIRRDL